MRAKGEAHCRAMPVARLDTQGRADFAVLEWNEKACESGQFRVIDRAAVLAAFRALFADAQAAMLFSWPSAGPAVHH